MDELLLDYLLDQLPPGDRAVVGGLIESDPAVAARLNALSALLTPLSADAEADEPPPGLAVAAIARTAEYAVANGLFTAADGFAPPAAEVHPDAGYREARWLPLVRGWVNVAVAALIVLLLAGLGVAAVQKGREAAQMAACQNNLRELHAGLVWYGEAHNGRLPQPGTPSVPFAGEVYAELDRGGQGVSAAARACPAVLTQEGVGYAYSLGFRDQLGRLVGPTLPDPVGDDTPIASDLPNGGHGGWNVLTAGGAVRHTRTPTQPNGDDIFRNDSGLRQAGLHRYDVVLGRPFDVP